MTIIQGGPKPIVALPAETFGRPDAKVRADTQGKVIPQGEAAARYSPDKDESRDLNRGRAVNVEA